MKFMFMVVFLLFNFGIFCYGYNSNRIWNGTAVPDGKYPNVPRLITFSMQSSDRGVPESSVSLCTASIISPRHILTAAHCVHTFTDKAIVNELMIVDFDKIDLTFKPNLADGKKIHLKEHGIATIIHPHEKWMAETMWINDIAIIEFDGGINLGIEPMLLAKNYEEGDNDTALSLGYGDTDPHPVDQKVPTALMEIPVPVIKDCAWKNDKDAKMVCAGTKTTRTDHGDSGGPLVIEKDGKLFQIGVVQFGSYKNGTLADNDADFGIYTRVSAYCDWIEKTTKGDAKCVDILQNTNEPTQAPVPAPNPASTSPSVTDASGAPDPAASSLPTPNALIKNDESGGEMSYVYPLLLFISALIIAF